MVAVEEIVRHRAVLEPPSLVEDGRVLGVVRRDRGVVELPDVPRVEGHHVHGDVGRAVAACNRRVEVRVDRLKEVFPHVGARRRVEVLVLELFLEQILDYLVVALHQHN